MACDGWPATDGLRRMACCGGSHFAPHPVFLHYITQGQHSYSMYVVRNISDVLCRENRSQTCHAMTIVPRRVMLSGSEASGGPMVCRWASDASLPLSMTRLAAFVRAVWAG